MYFKWCRTVVDPLLSVLKKQKFRGTPSPQSLPLIAEFAPKTHPQKKVLEMPTAFPEVKKIT